MPILRLNIFHRVLMYIPANEGSTPLLNEGETIKVHMSFVGSMEIGQNQRTREDLQHLKYPRLEAKLWPTGESDDDYLAGQVWRLDDEQSEVDVIFLLALGSILQPILTESDESPDFPFKIGQIVEIPAVVKDISKEVRTIAGNLYRVASLVPAGEAIDGLVTVEATLIEE